METVVDRIERVMNERGWSARELARRAGLKPESQLSGILARLRGDPDAVELRTLKKIAAGAEVPWEWLLTGRDDLVEEALRSKRFRDLPGWPGLLEAAPSPRVVPGLPFLAIRLPSGLTLVRDRPPPRAKTGPRRKIERKG